MFYIYDEQNKQFNGMTQGQKNPKNVGFLQPANSTLLAPPTEFSINEVPTYNLESGAWELGVSQYKKDLNEALLSEENEHGFKIYELVNEEVVARDAVILQAEIDAKLLEESLRQSQVDLENMRLVMDTNIITKAADITKGTTTESIQAFTSAFQLRASNPGSYTSAGLKAYYAIDTFAVLDALDTEAKISQYYSAVLVELDLFREAEIAKYLTEKALLEQS